MGDKNRRTARGQLDLLPTEGIDWSHLEPTRRVWLEDVGGDHRARLDFLSGQGLRLMMADRGPGMGETLHFSNPRDGETLHLRAQGGRSLLPEAAGFFPAARVWQGFLHGDEDGGSRGPIPANSVVRYGLLLEVEGGFVIRSRGAWREYPQGVLRGVKASRAAPLLEAETALHLSFLQALEDARGLNIPVAAVASRAVLLETARVLAHLAWTGAASAALGRWRTAAACEGMRLELRTGAEDWLDGYPRGGWAVAGGVREDFPLQRAVSFAAVLAAAAATWRKLSRRVASLPVPAWAERRLGRLAGDGDTCTWTGPLARAAGTDLDVRKEEPGIYPAAGWESAVVPEGSGMLRRVLAVKAGEVTSSLEVARRILEEPPDPPLLVKRGRGGRGEGFGRCEGPEGEVCCHVLLEKGRISHIAFSLPRERNRSAARALEGCRLDEVDLLSLLWRGA